MNGDLFPIILILTPSPPSSHYRLSLGISIQSLRIVQLENMYENGVLFYLTSNYGTVNKTNKIRFFVNFK